MRLFALAMLLVWPASGWAQATTATCVEVLTRRDDADELRRLVVDELDRHATHRSAEEGCTSYLRVETIEVAEGRYLTGRINDQVPHRERIQGEDLAGALTRLLTVVLHNDPVRLRGPRTEGWFRGGLRVLKRGHSMWGIEAYQTAAWLDGGPSSLPGLALSFRREVADWHLGARMAYAGRVGEDPETLVMKHHVLAQLQLAWFASSTADASFYYSALIGLEHQRYSGPAPGFGEGEFDEATATGLGVGARVGVELFRTTTGRLDLFAHAQLPAFAASDEEGGVVDAWMPTFGIGAGILF